MSRIDRSTTTTPVTAALQPVLNDVEKLATDLFGKDLFKAIENAVKPLVSELSTVFSGLSKDLGFDAAPSDAAPSDPGTAGGDPTAGGSPTTGTSATQNLYEMPTAGPAPLVNAINGATQSIDLSIYLMTDTNIINALEAAAQRGVKVRVMIEPTPVSNGSTPSNYPQLQQQLTAAGCQVEPTPPQFDSNHNVDHAKFFVVDGADTWIGSGNLVRSSLEGNANGGDRDFWLQDDRGETASEAEQLFNADWNRQSTSGINFQNLVVTPDNSDARLLGMIDGAKTTLLVYNQEMQDPTIVQHLIAAKQRGVNVQVLCAAPYQAGGTDNNAAAVQQLQAAGVDAKEMSSIYLHGKAMVADGQAFIGSENFSSNGLTINREMGDVTDDANIVSQLTQMFQSDFSAN